MTLKIGAFGKLRVNGHGPGRCESGAKGRPFIDRRAIGGFYEAIMAMMVVTLGVLLLTGSFAFLTVDQAKRDTSLERRCQEVMDLVLENRSIASTNRMLDNRTLSHIDWNVLIGNRSDGLRVMLTFTGGTVRTLFSSGHANATVERASLSEPVNLFDKQADIKAALLTVWVWP